MIYKIYKLIYNDKVVYVGKTKKTLRQRMYNGYEHNKFIKDIYKDCKMELIEETDDTSRERYWIDFYKETTLNIQKGDGLDYKKRNIEYREKIKESKKRYMRQYHLRNKNGNENIVDKSTFCIDCLYVFDEFKKYRSKDKCNTCYQKSYQKKYREKN